MRILKDFKVPNFKFPKFKMKEVSEIDEMNIDYEKVKQFQENKNKKENKNYIQTTYKTIKEIFEKSTKEYAKEPFILEKFFDNKLSFSKACKPSLLTNFSLCFLFSLLFIYLFKSSFLFELDSTSLSEWKTNNSYFCLNFSMINEYFFKLI